MDKVLEVYNNVKDRLSNPFVFSFLCSWLIFNWRIPVSLIWYDKSQFSGCGCTTIFDFISYELSKTNSFLFPLFFAFVYSLSIPFIKNGVRIVSAFAQKWGENEEIKALDGGKIGFDKYLALRDNYLKQIKELEKIAGEEKTYLEDNKKLLLEINAEKEKLNEEIRKNIENQSFINELNNISILQGKWNCIIGDKNTSGISYHEELSFNQYDIYEVTSFNNSEKVFDIKHFFYNNKTKKVFFIKKRYVNSAVEIPFDNRYKINDLYFKDSDTLVGKENDNNIEYKRIK